MESMEHSSLLRDPQGYRFALKLDSMDVDRYLPPPSEKPAGEAPQKPAGAQPAAG